MKWIKNNISQENIENEWNMIDKDLLIDRLCYTLQCNRRQLLKYISLDEIKRIISTLLFNRKINENKIDKVFNNISSSITNPHDIINIDKASDKIIKYLNDKNSVIFIYSDYDCDGIMSGYIIYDILKSLSKGEVYVYFPERKDKYGLNMSFCKNVANYDKGKTLVITVDNGITKKEEISFLIDNNIDVIVTDHHPSKENETPDCIIIDPSNTDNEQDEYKHLCGTEIAFKLCQVIKENYNQYDMMKYTPYVALSILSDVMPLNDENIALLQYGLDIINSKYCPPAIKALKNKINVDILSTKDILWSIAPMINACGRMNNTALASQLFLYQYDYDISSIIDEIEKTNNNRKDLTKNLVESFDMFDFEDDKVCILPMASCPIGMLGILAGKAVEKYNRPAIVVAPVEDGIYSGSARSYNGINLVELLKQMQDLEIINSYGGHPEACVCSFNINNLEKVSQYFNEHISDEQLTISSEDIEEEINIDCEISLSQINKYVFTVANMFPYDSKKYNIPTFKLSNLQIVGYKLSKNNSDNIQFTFREENKKKTIDIWAWKFGNKYINEMGCPEHVNIVGQIQKSFMNNKYTFNIVDIVEA